MNLKTCLRCGNIWESILKDKEPLSCPKCHNYQWNKEKKPREIRLCKVSNCNNKHAAKGFCFSHYRIWRRNGNPTPLKNYNHSPVCTIEGCNNKYETKGFCSKHYERYRKWGSPDITHNERSGRKGIKGKGNPRWNGGTSDYPNHCQMKKVRKELLKTFPKCIICEEPVKQIHHIDYSKNKP